MASSRYVFQIGMREDGEIEVINADGKPAEELDAKQMAKELSGRQIVDAKVLPQVTCLRANPCWVNIGGRWYRC